MNQKEIRKMFFDYFQKNNHKKVSSSSLIPAEDPTLLFTNAGMNQFKDLFLDKEKRPYTRATTIQKCVRAGGKHNDLDNVGFTKRHLTFFEMMGNFSFGDYFKKEAIQFAWEFLTKEAKIPGERLVATVFKDDDEAYDIWHEVIGLPKNRIFRCGEKDNFWSMGDTGPCGPCSEILYDKGKEFGPDCADPNECDERFLEIWNLVFMQYDRQSDGTLVPLKQTGVDTGMGFERLALVLQEKDTVYETDIFTPLIKKMETLTGLKYEKQSPEIKAAFNVLADHIRSSCLIIADGCTPSNEGRGYVLRKIIRRAALFDQKLSIHPLFPLLAETFIEDMGDVYPELKTHKKLILSLLKFEVEKFAENLERGQQILQTYFEKNKDSKKITGEQAFKLYDTFGFPYEITDLAAREKGFEVDHIGFEKLMKIQRIQSNQRGTPETLTVKLDPSIKTEFTGYDSFETESAIQVIIKDNKITNEVNEEDECWIIPQESPFYVERGGQIGDEGTIVISNEIIPALDLQLIDDAIAIKIHAPQRFKIGQKILQKVDCRRINTMKNHTSTHLLQAALLQVLGNQIKQAGSLVTPDYLRFDFNYHENLTPGIIKEIEEIVNEAIWKDYPVNIKETSLEEAKKEGFIAHFGEKYNPEKVRVIQINDFSKELCGGTHIHSTGQIGSFKITDIEAISAGTRRIFATTGRKALELFQDSFRSVKALGQLFKVQPDAVYETVEHQIDELKNISKENKKLKTELIKYQIPTLLKKAQTVQNYAFLYLEQSNMPIESLREIAQLLAQKQSGFFFVTSSLNDKQNFVASISPNLKEKINLKKLSSFLNDTRGLRGGGNPLLIQGGGAISNNDLEKTLLDWIQNDQKTI
jgi:alanyl-tRNA synthetase